MKEGEYMKKTVLFREVDVFTEKPYQGNPVAVVMNGDKFTDNEMQKIANWLHLSETTFICSPTSSEADYRLRIFSPKHELPFAGHPTIGSAKAILNSGLVPNNKEYLVQECKQGLIKIYIKDNKLFLTLPNPKKYELSTELLDNIATSIGIDTDCIQLNQIIDVGAIWITLQLENDKQVLELSPDYTNLARVLPPTVTGVTVFGSTKENSSSDFEVRSFVPNEGVTEDPVCGSGNGCVAIMVKEHHLINKSSYITSQGKILGRDGHVMVDLSQQNQIFVGGNAITCIEGNILIS